MPQRLRPQTELQGPTCCLSRVLKPCLAEPSTFSQCLSSCSLASALASKSCRMEGDLEATSVEDGGRQAEGGARRAEGR